MRGDRSGNKGKCEGWMKINALKKEMERRKGEGR